MRRLADELDTGPASLYWHVGSKDGLLELIFDRVIGEVEMPDPEPERWQEQLKEVARAGRAMILRHRDIVRISIGRIPMGPNALRAPRGSSRSSGREASRTNSRSPPTTFSSRSSTASPSTRRQTSASRLERPLDEQAANAARDYVAQLPVDRFPNLVAVSGHFGLADNDQSFELLIDLFVDGLAQRIHARDQ